MPQSQVKFFWYLNPNQLKHSLIPINAFRNFVPDFFTVKSFFTLCLCSIELSCSAYFSFNKYISNNLSNVEQCTIGIRHFRPKGLPVPQKLIIMDWWSSITIYHCCASWICDNDYYSVYWFIISHLFIEQYVDFYTYVHIVT